MNATMRKTIVTLVTFLIITGLSFSSVNAESDLVLATATTGGTYYPVGVALATLTSIKLTPKHKITMRAITSAGSGENVILLRKSEAQLAILQGLFGAMAWQGKGKYEGDPQKHMRSITMLWENVEHFSVNPKLAKTGNINDLKQFGSQKFSIGARNSGSRVSGETILTALGIDPNKMQLEYMGYNPSSKAMQDLRIEGMNTPAGPPVSAVTQAYARLGAKGIRILEFTDEQIKQVNSEFPVWSRYVIPKGTYPGQTEAFQTIAQPNFLAVHPDVDEEVVYMLVKTIYENLPFLHNIHKATRAMKLQRAIVGLPVPLHPGAAKYYKEQNITIPNDLMMP